MARYIYDDEALQIIDSYAKTVTKDGKVVVDAIRDIVAVIAPAADVVPKAEVEKIFEEIEEFHKIIYDRYVFEDNDYAEDDVAIECAMNYGTDISNMLVEFKKKYIGDKE